MKATDPHIPGDKLKSYWKQAIAHSLTPDSEHQAYVMYYLLIRSHILSQEKKLDTENLNEN
jgi:hypothetical protein